MSGDASPDWVAIREDHLIESVADALQSSPASHAAGKPVAMIPNCAATRHAHFTLDGSGPAYLETPKLDDWPQVQWAPDKAARRVISIR